MYDSMTHVSDLKPSHVLQAYRHGLFPMADSRDSKAIQWICPQRRGVLPVAELHIPRRLLKTIRAARYKICIDRAFADVMQACAAPTPARPDTWINRTIFEVFCALHRKGHAHSVEVWDGEALVGGLYGLKMGGAFFGESMFSRRRDASKIALVHLAARLWCGGFTLLDVQFTNDHLQQFGLCAYEHEDYMALLSTAITQQADFAQHSMPQDILMQRYLVQR